MSLLGFTGPVGPSPVQLAGPLSHWLVPCPAGPSPVLLAVPCPAGLLECAFFLPSVALVAESAQLALMAGLCVPGKC